MKTSKNSFEISPHKSIKWSSYFPIYDALFSKYQGRKITFVEVGILDGGSLFMWRDFFGEDARIIGVEFNPEAKKWEEHGFEIFIGDQSDPEFWKRFYEAVGPIDVLLDDGGHTYDQQIATLECSKNNVNDGGLIAIEDTHTSYMSSLGYPTPYTFIEYAKGLVDDIGARHPFAENAGSDDKKIWNVQFFDSIVAFGINALEASREPSWVENQEGAVVSRDFRHDAIEGKYDLTPLQRFKNRFRRLDRQKSDEDNKIKLLRERARAWFERKS